MHIFCTTHLCISPVGAVEWNTVNNNSAVMTHEHCKIIQQELSSCWDGRPFGQNRRGRKVVAVVPLSVGELGPQLTQCRLSRGLPWSQVASWSIQPYGHNRQSWKLVGVVPLFRAAGSPSKTVWSVPRPASIPSGILIHPTVWPQYTNVTDRTDRQRSDS